ncbi:phage-related major capsid protein [Mycobacteroides abscessus subsp. massiliense]|uniref:phage major capsid protein n=1 Tax=Mycobacteroides abscessus TaxID=36809 RepID=UPI0009A7B1E6|nr:phage major capsid protein [Mycobacteroides abscessus]SKM81098.1 phage-related major capsid protein [Mycobacteroides abscessus subsp. massiliense]SKM97553.1 phage-related major capsid protein [Mycobacteroides abscessus subsp. massiliense]SKN76483.1 phage-related major capsid protein [Mycobacteroides abscessus subsp. massiliense]SKN96704.1 phage-related major capsid protein [Mycobacteroides abscessus subsp. massiliense]SKO21101.1 phage-related major capsid protein [Mycobacteroides abscessus 
MEERLKRLLALRAKAGEELDKLMAERQAITDIVKEEAREDLSAEEDVEFRAKTAEIAKKQTECDGLDERVKELSDEIERSGRLDSQAQAVRKAQARIAEVKEAAAYEKGSGRSYFKDLVLYSMNQDTDGSAAERLRRHAVDVKGANYRALDRVDGNGGYFVPPIYLVSQYIELARSGRAFANLLTQQPLPAGTDSINIPKVTRGTLVGAQTADNAAVASQDLQDAQIRADVRTIAGEQNIAIQLLDQSPINFDEVVFQDLIADYGTKVDLATLTGSGTAGQVKGVHNTPGIQTIAVTAVDLTKFYGALADAIQRVHTLRFLSPTVVVMHPRRWAWLTGQLDSQKRPLVLPAGRSFNNVATLDAVASQQVVGEIQGLPVVTDPNLPTTLGTNSDEDVVYVLRAPDLLLFESGIRTRVLNEVGGHNLQVTLQVYGYLAFTAERYPQSVVEISGLTAPTF